MENRFKVLTQFLSEIQWKPAFGNPAKKEFSHATHAVFFCSTDSDPPAFTVVVPAEDLDTAVQVARWNPARIARILNLDTGEVQDVPKVWIPTQKDLLDAIERYRKE